MNFSLSFVRVLFVLLSTLFMALYISHAISAPTRTEGLLMGVGVGLLFSLLLVSFDTLFKKLSLRTFNVAIVGIFVGYLMGQSLILLFNSVMDISRLSMLLQTPTIDVIKIGLLLFGTYFGTLTTLRAADEFYLSIPFVKFVPSAHKKKDLLIDFSALSDGRVIDLATTGLLDHQLVIPRFLIKEIYGQTEVGDEMSRSKARRALEVVKKLEGIPHLELRFNDTDFPEVKDLQGKLTRLARLLDANIITSDSSKLQTPYLEGIRTINLHALSSALKPLMQAGELIKIKIQRYGKEPRQGVGYLEDGTMVVVNGGGEYIGELIAAHVLSVKHTSSGRMIFCNVQEEDEEDEEDSPHYITSEREDE